MLSCLGPCRSPPDINYLLTCILEAGESVGTNNCFQQISGGRDFLLIRISQYTSLDHFKIDFTLCDFHLDDTNLPSKSENLMLCYENM